MVRTQVRSMPAVENFAPHRADAPCSAQADVHPQGMGEHPLRVKSANPPGTYRCLLPSGAVT
ncbi:hypothetical protein [Methanofollis ethanolicus]|uniref:hypothetical protein n=1 Tax=Methanofollis ethanolicus TaxID=488124 RepID=UPI00128EF163|nr:hypothetical protein [Methanofollis ethanolicus]